MFKKKGGGRKINLEEEAEQVSTATQQNNNPSPQQSPVIPIRNQRRGKGLSWEAMEKLEEEATVRDVTGMLGQRKVEKVDIGEIEECFNDLREQRKQWEEQHQELSDVNQVPVQSQGQVIIEDNHDEERQVQYIDVLDVEEDLDGGFSPIRDHQDDYHIDFEQQLIRKTLTHSNYQRVAQKTGISLQQAHQAQVKDQLYHKTIKSSAKNIERTIARDLHLKKEKLGQLQKRMGQMQKAGLEERSALSRKEGRLRELREKMERMRKVIEFVYYRGDKIKEFNEKEIYKQAMDASE